MTGAPDPKPGKTGRKPIRVVDPKALRKLLLMERACVACGGPASNADHLIRRGHPHFGDDVVENLVPLCGSGSDGCHGARHGTPYVDGAGRRWTPQEVRQAIGRYLATRHEKISYVVGKLGADAGREHLATYFGVYKWTLPEKGEA